MMLPSTPALMQRFRHELSDVNGELISGLFAVTDQLTNIGSYREIIAPTAFANAMEDVTDVGMLWSHDSNSPMAKAPATLRLGESQQGLVCVGVVTPDSYVSRMVLAEIERRTVSGGSFGFLLDDEDYFWVLDDGVPLRVINTVSRLFEVSPVMWPAYRSTSIWSSRSAANQRGAYQQYVDNARQRLRLVS